MRKFLIILTVILMPNLVWGQAQINTKKVKISDFTQKITKVVLTGNMFYDSSLEDEIVSRWKVSPYEFCSMQEFETLKGNDEYYFLITTNGQFKKESEPGLQFLTLVKGGEKAESGIDDMLEIVSLPICSANDPSGRETTFFPAFLDIIQNYALDSMEKDVSAYIGLSNYSLNLAETKGLTIIFSENDLSQEITKDLQEKYLDQKMIVTDEDTADRYMSDMTADTAISYVAVPSEAKPGAYCYKMLIDSQSHKLYYFKKHRITKKIGSGFLAEDIRRIAYNRNR